MSILTKLPVNLYRPDAFAEFSAEAGFSRGTARALIWLSQLAYETDEPEKMARVLRAWGLGFSGRDIVSREVQTVLPVSRTEAFVATGEKAVFLSFAGTDPIVLANWITDFDVRPSKMGIAAGFETAAGSVRESVRDLLAERADMPVFVTGHSLGGALAVVAAQSLLEEGFNVGAVYTFGMPRPGTEAFKVGYDQRLGDRTYRMVHGHDVVPTVAPSELGFRHVGRVLACPRLSRFETADLSPDTSSDDPAFGPGISRAFLEDLHKPFQLVGSVLGTFGLARRGHGLQVRGPQRTDAVGALLELLPLAIRDHLPDRYIGATS